VTAAAGVSGHGDVAAVSAGALPTVSVLIPTLNSERTLGECLDMIRAQDYPAQAVEIIIADGGSKDATLEIARLHGAIVVTNPLVTGEAGKAAALRIARNEIVALIDSDNILVGTDWLKKMVRPFEDARVAGSEPIRFEALPGDGYIDRYCALAGANDPLCLFIGNYDRQSAITGSWTGLPVEIVRASSDFRVIALRADRPFPTIGANGTMYRREAIAPLVGAYLMDIDLPVQLAMHRSGWLFAKVDCGIRHLYCRDFSTFVRKQERRIRDFRSPKHRDQERAYPWKNMMSAGIVRFSLACITIVPLFWQVFAGYRRSRDWAIWFHPLACLATFWIYAVNIIFLRGREVDRSNWKQ
jgi:glycosyltransferase involved in cell wall biosynthesis